MSVIKQIPPPPPPSANTRTLVLFATYKISQAILSEFEKMQNCGVECILGIHNTCGAVEDDQSGAIQIKNLFGVEAKCLLLYQKDLEDLGLHIERDVGYTLWHSTDYWVYFAKKHFPDFDFYWEIDYDCFLNAPNYKNFFEFYKHNNADFIVSNFRQEHKDSKWYWVPHTDWAYDDSIPRYGSLFAIARYSRAFIDILYQKRRDYTILYKNFTGKKQWLMCKYFTATEAMLHNFKVHNFTEEGHKIRIARWDLNTTRIFVKPDDKMYHPIKENPIIKEKITIKEKPLPSIYLVSAKDRIHSHLAYKLGQALILNSKSLWGYIRMPYVLSYIKESHKKEMAKYEARVAKNPALKLPKLESYADYKEALKEKECFTYKLGVALIQANKSWYKGGFLRFFFQDLPRLKKEFRDKRK